MSDTKTLSELVDSLAAFSKALHEKMPDLGKCTMVKSHPDIISHVGYKKIPVTFVNGRAVRL